MQIRAVRRVGVVVPAGNVLQQRELSLLRPAQVSFDFAGFRYPTVSDESYCEQVVEHMRVPLHELAAGGAEIILIGCTTVTMQCTASVFRQQLEQTAGVPVITAAAAGQAACAAVGARKLVVATPYGERNNLLVQRFLDSLQLEVLRIEGLDLDRTAEIWLAAAPALTPERVLALAGRVDTAQADTLYLPCTGMCSLEVIEPFERAHHKTAISSVQAGYWACLRALGIDGRQRGFGRLLEQWDF